VSGSRPAPPAAAGASSTAQSAPSAAATARPVTGNPAPAVADEARDDKPQDEKNQESVNRSSAAPASLSTVSVVALVLSALGFLLITVPFGLWLGYRGVSETSPPRPRRDGLPLAKAAVVLGWAWVVFWVLALIAYLWILL